MGTSHTEVIEILGKGEIAVLVDPELSVLAEYDPLVLVDARMTKKPPEIGMESAPLVIGLGPGFKAGDNCHAVIETMRGHTLGRVIWEGEATKNTGVPGSIGSKTRERVLRAPADGLFTAMRGIGDLVKSGDVIGTVKDQDVTAQIDGILRGVIRDGLNVRKGLKLGDIDPRAEVRFCYTISDKSRAIAGSVLEAIMRKYNK